MSNAATADQSPRLYDDEGDLLLQSDQRADRLIMIPTGDPRIACIDRDRIRIQWGQHLLADLLARRYRTFVCGVNPVDNSHGIITQLAELLPTSQWNERSVTQYAKAFSDSLGDDEMLVLKYDMDAVEVLALLRPRNRDYFTLSDLAHGFKIVAEMVEGRHDRLPVASVSFIGAKSNQLRDDDGGEPSFESVLRTMYEDGYRGDVYPSLCMWELAPTAVLASYPFPTSLDVMRKGGF